MLPTAATLQVHAPEFGRQAQEVHPPMERQLYVGPRPTAPPIVTEQYSRSVQVRGPHANVGPEYLL